jgi:hypothetical protein
LRGEVEGRGKVGGLRGKVGCLSGGGRLPKPLALSSSGGGGGAIWIIICCLACPAPACDSATASASSMLSWCLPGGTSTQSLGVGVMDDAVAGAAPANPICVDEVMFKVKTANQGTGLGEEGRVGPASHA